MKKAYFFFIFLFLFSTVPLGVAHNPFTSKPEKNHKVLTSPVKSTFFVKIVFWQHQIREKMSRLIREARSEKKITPIFLLAMFAVGYGVIHSAGPGHGKAIALSYILSCRPNLPQSILFGNLVALTHGLSGIFLVLGVKFILHASMTQSLETMTYITQMISFSLISLLGGFIFIRSLINWFKKKSIDEKRPPFFNPYITAFSVGLIPCPGVVMVMLFALSLNLMGLGIFLGFCIALGMTSTITVIVLLGMSGKAVALRLSRRNRSVHHILAYSIETAAGLLVASLGLILLRANL